MEITRTMKVENACQSLPFHWEHPVRQAQTRARWNVQSRSLWLSSLSPQHRGLQTPSEASPQLHRTSSCAHRVPSPVKQHDSITIQCVKNGAFSNNSNNPGSISKKQVLTKRLLFVPKFVDIEWGLLKPFENATNITYNQPLSHFIKLKFYKTKDSPCLNLTHHDWNATSNLNPN